MHCRIPLAVKLGYSAFFCAFVPYYLAYYGPTNFLYYCDVAAIMTVVALWKEDSLWASTAAVGILVPQAVWIVDFIGQFFGISVVGMTGYMFNPKSSLVARGISLFHLWLPLLLLWMLSRIGYDRRAFLRWTILAWILMPICYFALPPSGPHDPSVPVNVNYVYGLDDDNPQTLMPPLAWLALLMVAQPAVIFLPTHLVLYAAFRSPHQVEIQGM